MSSRESLRTSILPELSTETQNRRSWRQTQSKKYNIMKLLTFLMGTGARGDDDKTRFEFLMDKTGRRKTSRRPATVADWKLLTILFNK